MEISHVCYTLRTYPLVKETVCPGSETDPRGDAGDRSFRGHFLEKVIVYRDLGMDQIFCFFRKCHTDYPVKENAYPYLEKALVDFSTHKYFLETGPFLKKRESAPELDLSHINRLEIDPSSDWTPFFQVTHKDYQETVIFSNLMDLDDHSLPEYFLEKEIASSERRTVPDGLKLNRIYQQEKVLFSTGRNGLLEMETSRGMNNYLLYTVDIQMDDGVLHK